MAKKKLTENQEKYSGRGKAFEKTILEYFEVLQSRHIYCEQNNIPRTETGIRTGTHGFDFQIMYNGIFYGFDAKNCDANRFTLSNCKTHQIDALVNISTHQGDGFFLVLFTKQKKLCKIPATDILQMKIDGIKSIAYDEKYMIPTLNFLGIK